MFSPTDPSKKYWRCLFLDRLPLKGGRGGRMVIWGERGLGGGSCVPIEVLLPGAELGPWGQVLPCRPVSQSVNDRENPSSPRTAEMGGGRGDA